MISTKHIDKDGDEFWKLPNGRVHREDGPAIIYTNGTKHWIVNGDLHREDGPATFWYNGEISWYLHGYECEFDMYCIALKRDYDKTDEDIMLLKMQYSKK